MARIFDDWPYLGRVLSILIGFGIATMCRARCSNDSCIQYKGPSVKEIDGSVYQYGVNCVQFKTKAMECPKTGKLIQVIGTKPDDD